MKLATTTSRVGRSTASTLLAGVVVATLTTGCSRTEDHQSFASADAAVSALVEGIKRDDRQHLERLLGPGTEDLLSSGDAVQDKNDRARFVAVYTEKHALVPSPDEASTQILFLGHEQVAFAIPISNRSGRWYLDGNKGADEIVYRRIGANELGAIEVCQGFVEAQAEYASAGRDGDAAGIYALKLISDHGMQNGLYWPTVEGEAASPAGSGVAAAAAEGYSRKARMPYHGYYYRMLYRQGAHAKGGAREYFKDGVLTQGFALIAWPASYQSSGVMTFIVNQDGSVFQRDLGPDTESDVAAITAFDPDTGWALASPTARGTR